MNVLFYKPLVYFPRNAGSFNAPGERRPTGERVTSNPKNVRCGPSAPVDCSARDGGGEFLTVLDHSTHTPAAPLPGTQSKIDKRS